MRSVCWITKATDTHSEYVILIAFLQQQWLGEIDLLLFLCLGLIGFFNDTFSALYDMRVYFRKGGGLWDFSLQKDVEVAVFYFKYRPYANTCLKNLT
jgi:hypothetical protein